MVVILRVKAGISSVDREEKLYYCFTPKGVKWKGRLIAFFSGLFRVSHTSLCRSSVWKNLSNVGIERRPADVERVAEMWLGRQVGQIKEGFVDFCFCSKEMGN